MKTNEKLGQEPTFPTDYTLYEGKIIEQQIGSETYKAIGISKRFYAACAAMQGLASMHHSANDIDNDWIAKTAFNMADKLLCQENL